MKLDPLTPGTTAYALMSRIACEYHLSCDQEAFTAVARLAEEIERKNSSFEQLPHLARQLAIFSEEKYASALDEIADACRDVTRRIARFDFYAKNASWHWTYPTVRGGMRKLAVEKKMTFDARALDLAALAQWVEVVLAMTDGPFPDRLTGEVLKRYTDHVPMMPKEMEVPTALAHANWSELDSGVAFFHALHAALAEPVVPEG